MSAPAPQRGTVRGPTPPPAPPPTGPPAYVAPAYPRHGAPPPYQPPGAPAGRGGAPGRPTEGGDTDQPRWHYRRSLASRVLLLTMIAVGLSTAVLAVGVYITVRLQLQGQLDESLRSRAEKVARYETLGGPVNSAPYALGASDIRLLVVTERNGQFLAEPYDGDPTSTRLIGSPEFDVASGDLDESVRTVRLETDTGLEEYRVVTVAADEPGNAVVIAQSLASQQAVLARLGGISLLFGLLGVLGAGVAGWGVVRNGLRPVRRLTTRVEEIARTEKLDPLRVEGDDEIARLATAFNEMLLALGASRDRQRRLVTDAGHELRTPLTSLRTNVDLLIQADDDQVAIEPAAKAELLEDIRGQIDELTTLIGDLTELARDEPLAPVVGEVDLSELVDVSVARVRRRALERTLDVETESWLVVGEAPALERALTNLLDNAAKWSPTDGRITVRLRGGVLVVDDQGPGIAEADRERVFDRFWRAEESRSMPGSGLGLSIVRQVAERHSGTVHAEAAPGGGARLVLRLPGRAGGPGA